MWWEDFDDKIPICTIFGIHGNDRGDLKADFEESSSLI
jgi:hypothetical protein